MHHSRLLSRYVKKNALFAMLFAIIGLWMLQLFFSYLAQIEDLSDTYTYLEALKYIGYLSPYFLQQFIPTGALLGSVVGLGLLANNSELVAMRAAGISIYRLVGWVLQPALLFVFLALGINQFILPHSNQLANQISDPDSPLLTSVSGYWTLTTTNASETGETVNEIIFIDYADAKGNIGLVKHWVIDANNHLVSVSQALSGHYYTAKNNESKSSSVLSNNNAAYQWQLNNINTVYLKDPFNHRVKEEPLESTNHDLLTNTQVKDSPTIDKQLAEVQSDYFNTSNRQPVLIKTHQDRSILSLPISPSSIYLQTKRAKDLSLTDLYQHYRFNLAQGTRSLEHELAFWQKLLSPFAILSLVIVACSFVFGSLRIHSLGLRIVVALLFGLFFSYLQDLSGFLSLAIGVSPLLMVIIPIIVSAIFGLFLLKRQM